MSKFMSILEKMRVVEKVNGEDPGYEEMTNNNALDEIMPEDVSETNKEPNFKTFKKPDRSENRVMQDKQTYEKNKSIDEIYASYDLDNSNINTVFMLGNFINALPENLPYVVKRSSVASIINASDANLNALLNDGERRLKILEQFSNDYTAAVNNIIMKNKEEIKKLKNMIEYYEAEISIKETMLEEQTNIIKYENQKIKSIINFFNKDE